MENNKRRLIPLLGYASNLLDRLRVSTDAQLAITACVKAALPIDLQVRVVHCITTAKTLTVFTDSANWATTLRFHGQTILDAVNNQQPFKLSAIRIKVLPEIPLLKSRRKPVLPSPVTVSIIMAHSDTVTDTQLKASLLRLGNTLLSRLQQEN